MPGYLVHRPINSNRARVLGIDAVLVNAASAEEAREKVERYVGRCRGPSECAYVREWSSALLSPDGFTADLNGLVIDGELLMTEVGKVR